MHLLARIFRFAFSLLAFVATVSCAQADSVTYGGVSFKVDSQEDLHDGNIKVVVHNKPFLLPKDGFERGLALAYLSETELAPLLSSDDLLTLVIGTLDGGDSEVAVRGMAAALRSRAMSPEVFSDFVARVGVAPRGRESIGAALRLAGDQVRDQTLCLCLPHTEFAELVGFDVQLHRNSFTSTCYTLLSAEALALFRKGEVTGVRTVLEALASLRVSDQQVIQDVKKTATIFKQFSEAAERGHYVAAVATLESLRKDPIVASAAAVGISATAVRFGEESLLRGDYAAAVYLLCHADFKQRTPQIHLMLSRAIRGLSTSQLETVIQGQTHDALLLYAGKDEALRGELVEYLERGVNEVLQNHDIQVAAAAIDVIATLRRDPSERNDVLRGILAAELLAQKRPAEAQAVVKQMHTQGVPLMLRLRLLASGSPLGFIAVLLLAVVLVAAVARSILVAFRRYQVRKAGDQDIDVPPQSRSAANRNAPEGVESPAENGGEKTFVFYPPEFRSSGWRGEYETLLAYFGLPFEATSHEIKIAYRNLVKEAHPDRNPMAGRETSDQFIEISKKYDRLLELYEHRNRGGKS